MDEKYQTWIKKHYPTKQSAIQKCEEACKKMKIAFPELKIIRGQIQVKRLGGFNPKKTEHWWCTNGEEIIDPTSHQYPTKIISYTPVDEKKGEPTGKCLNCGDLTYDFQNFCSDTCCEEFTEYLKKEQKRECF